MTRPAWVVTAGAAGLAGLASGLAGIFFLHQFAALVIMTTMLIAVVFGLALTLPAPIGARLILLLAIPGYPTAIAMAGIGSAVLYGYGAKTRYSLEPSYLLIYLPTIALTCLVAALAWRSRHRGAAAGKDHGAAAS